jgi:hypothetical protein
MFRSTGGNRGIDFSARQIMELPVLVKHKGMTTAAFLDNSP